LPAQEAQTTKQEGVYHQHVYSESWVYFIEGAGKVKIGTAHDPQERLKTLQTGSPVPLVLLARMRGGPILEATLHRHFQSARSHGEWYYLTDDLKEYIRSHAEILERELLIGGQFVSLAA
jgi:hypothetical protein